MLSTFLSKVEDRSALVGIVGIGYVGLPIAVSFAEAGFRVFGVDLREEKVAVVNAGGSHLRDVPSDKIKVLRETGVLSAATDFEALREADAVIICVPTPLAGGQPDLSRVVFAGEEIAKVLKPGSLFVLESTTYPGTTEELLQPLLEAGGCVAGQDFMLAYSPERIDPGNEKYSFQDIPKVVGGIDSNSAEAAVALYGQVVPEVVVVSGTREAELAKLIENTYRHVNIALVNELAIYSHELGIDIWESIEAAATKPFGFQAFWPSPGWGGHCIPLDPSYLSWKVRQARSHEVRFVELAQSINSEMPRHVIERISGLLNESGKPIKGSRILGVGIAYKGGTEDTRESPGIKILERLVQKGADVAYHDPLVPEVRILGEKLVSVSIDPKELASYDIVIVFVPQVDVQWEDVALHSRVVFDCCNVVDRRHNIHRL